MGRGGLEDDVLDAPGVQLTGGCCDAETCWFWLLGPVGADVLRGWGRLFFGCEVNCLRGG
jgi:hypothetical protein